MNFFEYINQIIIRIRQFVLRRRKLTFSLVSCVLLAIVIIGITLYFNNQKQQRLANEFYGLTQKISNADDKKAADKIVEDYLEKQKGGFFQNYLAVISLNEKISSGNFKEAAKIADKINLDTDDKLMSQLVMLQKAKAYILVKKYEEALSALENIDSEELTDIKTLNQARLYLLKGDKKTAAEELSKIIEKNETSAITSIFRNYRTLAQ